MRGWMARSTGFLSQLLPERLLLHSHTVIRFRRICYQLQRSQRHGRRRAHQSVQRDGNCAPVCHRHRRSVRRLLKAGARERCGDRPTEPIDKIRSCGNFRRSLREDAVIDTQIWTFSRRILQSLKLTQDENQAGVRATRRYGAFLELPVTLRA